MSTLMLILASVFAAEGTFYVESQATADKSSAEALVQQAADGGCDGRVVRKFVANAGWRYLFRSVEQTDRAAAVRCVEALPADASLYQVTGGVAEVIELSTTDMVLRQDEVPEAASAGESSETPPSPPPAAARVEPVEETVDEPATVDDPVGVPELTVDDVLARVASAHHAVGAADAVLFRFQRETPDGRVVDHVYAARDGDRYVEIDVVDGPGVSSSFGIVGDTAWLEPDPKEEVDASLTSEHCERFAPAAVLGLPWRFSDGVPDDEEFGLLRMERPVLDGERPVLPLIFDGGKDARPFRMGVDVGTWRIVYAVAGEGARVTRWEYGDYLEAGDGGVVPGSVVVTRSDERLDVVRVETLDLGPTLPEEWFRTGR